MTICAEISMVALRHPAGFRTMKPLGTHLAAGVRWHVIPDLVWGLVYDVSEKHCEGNLHLTCIAVSLSMTIMGT